MRTRREAWFEAQPELDPARLVFIDETGASTKMARLRGRARRGTRCRAAIPHGHWKTTTLVAALPPKVTGFVPGTQSWKPLPVRVTAVPPSGLPVGVLSAGRVGVGW